VRSVVLALAFLVCAARGAAAEPAPSPNPYLAAPANAPQQASLTGTRWRMTMNWDDGAPIGRWSWAEFQSDGTILYGYPDGQRFDNGRWRQRGSILVFDTNSMFLTGLGQIDGDTITGSSINVHGTRGTFVFERED